MKRISCAKCGARPAISATTPYCEVCMYRKETGREPVVLEKPKRGK